MKNPRLVTALLLLVTLPIAAAAESQYRFADAEPITDFDDMRPIPLPHAADFSKAFYIADVVFRRPAVAGLELAPDRAARDVNSMDEVPRSSWFTPRLGYRELSVEELLRGPLSIGPPELPIVVMKAKPEGNPGFVVSDARGEKYIVKFDPPEFPGVETTTSFVVNRLFWAFGYNVPEDFTIQLRKEDFNVEPGGKYTEQDVDKVLSLVAAPVSETYTATASLLIAGTYLGPTMDKGVREDDPNDTIAHEDRRVLRALHAFGAFVNHSDMRVDNAGDFYQGEPGHGHVMHYLLDFGEAFGGHGASHDRLWDGFEHWFSYGTAARNFVTLGLQVQPWEKIQYTRWKSVGAFEAEVFDPKEWKETFPFEPIRRSQPADDYWAAKIVGSLTREQLQALVQAAEYPEDGAADYMIETVWKRRAKVLETFMSEVSPIDAIGFENDTLELRDVRKQFFPGHGVDSRYEIRFRDSEGKEIDAQTLPSHDAATFQVSVPASLLEQAGGYVQVDVHAWVGGKAAPSAAQFHLRTHGSEGVRLVGVVH